MEKRIDQTIRKKTCRRQKKKLLVKYQAQASETEINMRQESFEDIAKNGINLMKN